ncbi:NAD-dependent epimerase/dehydratase family protein [Pseudofrankia inefficax]|uniref:UDP-glucose 4-epimerase n=1 Tax=Pseudofrankia inefficax (strain DSM 45817 / CECT 9037 / DDB 130130 / EuI1c) TaxID=298654 RepID=E3J9D5_PSEI1|nr:SDR family NAD(P)-dependent oxidoreductase [Pseudofrankia inefficax]ADP82154.1 NAD-dependent epimerase/dehydratase [Pseudofrankia inefficax]
MQVLVTGGAGFIGSHIVDALVEAGHQVRVLDALLPAVHRVRPEVNDAAEFRAGDVTDRSAVEAALDGVDAVCHQAAMVGLGVDLDDLPLYATHNDLGTAVLLAAMARRGVGRLVLASSMVVYGEGGFRCATDGPVRPGARRRTDLDNGRFEPPCPRCGAPLRSTPVTEGAPLDPRNVYAATKVAQEHLAAAWAAACGGTAVALRYHNVYGPRMPRNTPYAGVASLFRSALERGEAPRVFEDGGQLRDFVHVHDVAAANLAALEHSPEPGRLVPVNVGSGQAHTVGEMAGALAGAFGGPLPRVTGQYRIGDVRHIVASSDRARALLGYQPATTFEAGMTAFARDPLRA